MFCDLETERLTLKSIGYEDATFFFKEFSTDEVNTYLYDAEPCASIEEAKEWIAFFTEPDPQTQHRRLLVRKAEKAGFVRTGGGFYFEHFRGKDYPHDIYCKML